MLLVPNNRNKPAFESTLLHSISETSNYLILLYISYVIIAIVKKYIFKNDVLKDFLLLVNRDGGVPFNINQSIFNSAQFKDETVKNPKEKSFIS